MHERLVLVYMLIMKEVTTILLLFFTMQLTVAKEVDTVSFADYHEQSVKAGNYQIQDVFGMPYKAISHEGALKSEMILVDSVWTLLDTSIYCVYDSLFEREELPIEKLLLDHLIKRDYIRSPRHCGSDFFVISYLIDSSGFLIQVRILETIKNACDDSLAWEIKDADGINFYPLISNGRAYQAEYICKWDEEIYCLCDLVTKDKTRRDK